MATNTSTSTCQNTGKESCINKSMLVKFRLCTQHLRDGVNAILSRVPNSNRPEDEAAWNARVSSFDAVPDLLTSQTFSEHKNLIPQPGGDSSMMKSSNTSFSFIHYTPTDVTPPGSSKGKSTASAVGNVSRKERASSEDTIDAVEDYAPTPASSSRFLKRKSSAVTLTDGWEVETRAQKRHRERLQSTVEGGPAEGPQVWTEEEFEVAKILVELSQRG